MLIFTVFRHVWIISKGAEINDWHLSTADSDLDDYVANAYILLKEPSLLQL